MPRYEWQGSGSFRDGRNDRTVEPGDVVELPEHVGEPQKELERVEADDDGEPVVEDPLVDPSEAKVAEVEAAVSESDDYDAVLDVLHLERHGQDRTTAVDAIDARLDELEG